MTYDHLIDLSRDALLLVFKLGLPLLVVAMAVGLIVSLFQAMTQLQDQTVSLVPRILATLLAAIFLLPWAVGELVDYSTELIRNIPHTL